MENDDGEESDMGRVKNPKKGEERKGDGSGEQDDEEADEDETLEIDMDEVIDILKEFHKKREERANNAELLGNPRMKKRSNFETEEQKKERIKREERIFWEKMTTVLND